MKKRIKEMWIKALGSGKYKQMRNHLTNTKKSKFCRLGVLTDLYCKDKNVSKTDRNNLLGSSFDFLDRKVMDWAGIKTHDAEIPINKRKLVKEELVKEEYLNTDTCLSGMNDNRLTFKEIAEVIEVAF